VSNTDQNTEDVKATLLKLAQEQGFYVVATCVVCWAMYTMIVRNEKELRAELDYLKKEQKECNNYNRQVMEGLIRDNTILMREIRDEMKNK